MKKRTVHEQVPALLFLIAISMFFFIKAFEYGDVKLFPIITSSLVMAFSSIQLARAIKKTKEVNKKIAEDSDYIPAISWEKLKTPVVGYIMAAVYVAMIPTIGFFVSTAVFMVLFMVFLGYRKWGVILAVTVGIELAVYLLFVKELAVRIPHGILY